MTWSNLRFSVCRSFVTMATNLPSCFSIQFLEQLLKFLVNFTLLKYVKSQRKLWLFNYKRADFWLPNFGFERSLFSLLNFIFVLAVLTETCYIFIKVINDVSKSAITSFSCFLFSGI